MLERDTYMNVNLIEDLIHAAPFHLHSYYNNLTYTHVAHVYTILQVLCASSHSAYAV